MDEPTVEISVKEETKRYINYTDVTQLFGIDKRTLYGLVRKKLIPHVRVGERTVLFSIVEIEKWLAEHTVAVEKK